MAGKVKFEKMDWNLVFEKGLEKVRYMQESLGGRFPHITQNGKWLSSDQGHWTGGFWSGLLWMSALYPHSDEARLSMALRQAKKLLDRTRDNKTHDMGFIFGPGCVFGLHVINDSDLASMALAGAHNLCHLYAPRSGVIYAWDEPEYDGVAIVDTIMNLPILKWASDKERDVNLGRMATSVADQIAAKHVRVDFSTWHVVRWNKRTCRVEERTTHQGFSADSCWSRGQAWALYGFANMCRYTSEDRYLELSRNLAGYFWDHLDVTTRLPRWDFVFQDNTEEPIDAAAGSIAASGMLLLAQLIYAKDEAEAAIWRERAVYLLTSLVDHCFYDKLDEYGIIKKVTVDRPRDSGVNESSMYGDYYFMEAVFRLLNEGKREQLDMLY